MARALASRVLAAAAGCALLLPVALDAPAFLAAEQVRFRLAPGLLGECAPATGACVPVLSLPHALLLLVLLAAGALALHGAARANGESVRLAALLVPLAASLAILLQVASFAALRASHGAAVLAHPSYARLVPRTLALAGVVTLTMLGLAWLVERAAKGERATRT